MNKKAIEGFDGYYITEEGFVLHDDKPLKIQINKHNVPFIRLRRDKKYFTFPISKLVALTYIGKPLNSSDVVAFKDGNNHNYHISNLYWASRSEAYKNFYREENRYSELRLNKLRKSICKPVMSCKRTSQGLVEIKAYNSVIEAAKEMKVASASIIRCLKDINGSCMGFAWRYIDKEK